MGACNLNHSRQDVRMKLESQQEFLPKPLSEALKGLLEEEQKQETLNEIFHLLKKYDLSSEEEQEVRNQKLNQLLK
ncbi:hypothetical protein [Peribacillus sp. NPDC097295]|uniref:hypothetical protein n=1 Tax=Peribacillus sp. NPDC097295 TaxID=3364402 RepID=UPI00381ABBB9